MRQASLEPLAYVLRLLQTFERARVVWLALVEVFDELTQLIALGRGTLQLLAQLRWDGFRVLRASLLAAERSGEHGSLTLHDIRGGPVDGFLQLREMRFVQGRLAHDDRRLFPVAAFPVYRSVVEEREELVVLALGQRIELVIVAARAPHRDAQPHGGGSLELIEDVLDAVLLRDAAALAVDHVVTVEAGGEPLREGRLREQVPGDLLDREPVEWHVGVEGVDHPISPGPHGPAPCPR